MGKDKNFDNYTFYTEEKISKESVVKGAYIIFQKVKLHIN